MWPFSSSSSQAVAESSTSTTDKQSQEALKAQIQQTLKDQKIEEAKTFLESNPKSSSELKEMLALNPDLLRDHVAIVQQSGPFVTRIKIVAAEAFSESTRTYLENVTILGPTAKLEARIEGLKQESQNQTNQTKVLTLSALQVSEKELSEVKSSLIPLIESLSKYERRPVYSEAIDLLKSITPLELTNEVVSLFKQCRDENSRVFYVDFYYSHQGARTGGSDKGRSAALISAETAEKIKVLAELSFEEAKSLGLKLVTHSVSGSRRYCRSHDRNYQYGIASKIEDLGSIPQLNALHQTVSSGWHYHVKGRAFQPFVDNVN